MTREKISLTLTETKQTISLTKIPVDLVRSFVRSRSLGGVTGIGMRIPLQQTIPPKEPLGLRHLTS